MHQVLKRSLGAFFLAFFFSQNITRGSCSPSFWLDKLCVNQAEPSLKEIAIASFPVFLSQSSQMLVLWDEEYFGRLLGLPRSRNSCLFACLYIYI